MTKRCVKCNQEKDICEFGRRRNGHQSMCKCCNKDYQREHYRSNKRVYKQKTSEYKHTLRQQLYKYLQSHPCVDCGESDPVVLEFDHLTPADKEDGISRMIVRKCSWARILAEIEKCQVRCSNCHKRRTAKQFGWYKTWQT